MLCFCALVFVVLGAVRGCSPPVGGFVEPTEAEIVFNAEYVVIGKVTKIITPDPVLVYNTTYGAQLQISCQYKGANIARNITVIGAGLLLINCTDPYLPAHYASADLGLCSLQLNATIYGFIPGHCFANELKQNTEYILFLSKRDGGYFEQTSTARNTTDIKRFLQVCDLVLKYPIGINSDFPTVRCQAPTMLPDCERYNPSVVKPAPVAPPSPSAKPITHPPEHVENVQMADKDAAQKGQITTTPSGAETNHFLSFLLVFAIVLQALVFL